MPCFSDFILEPADEPANPQPGQFWVPRDGPDAGELHVWSANRNAWLNLFDDRAVGIPRRRRGPSLWRRLLRAVGVRI